MFSINPHPLPDHALLKRYVEQDAYTDCYHTEIDHSVTHNQFVEAFYTTWLFKLERLILKWSVSKPSTDTEAKQVAEGNIDHFAAWSVEDRADHQLLMCDFQGRTRSWFMTISDRNNPEGKTQLYFGSAVTKVPDKKTGKETLGKGYSLLLGFHKLYSVALLACARARIKRLQRQKNP